MSELNDSQKTIFDFGYGIQFYPPSDYDRGLGFTVVAVLVQKNPDWLPDTEDEEIPEWSTVVVWGAESVDAAMKYALEAVTDHGRA